MIREVQQGVRSRLPDQNDIDTDRAHAVTGSRNTALEKNTKTGSRNTALEKNNLVYDSQTDIEE